MKTTTPSKPCKKCGGTERYSNRKDRMGDCVRCATAAASKQYRKDPARSNARSVAWSKKNPERRKVIDARAHRKWKYGVTQENWDALLVAQSGRCWLCDEPLLSDPVVDHDHATDEVRGLAHGPCNTAFGMLRESSKLLRALADKAEELEKRRAP